MNNKWIVALFALTVFVDTSCNQCEDVICEGTGIVLPFHIIDQTTGADLFDSETGTFDFNQCALYRITTSDTIYYTVDKIRSTETVGDSLIALHVDARYANYYFQFSDGDVDTLSFRYNTSSSSCCGTVYEPTSVIWNGHTRFPSNDEQSTFTVRK